MSENMVRAPSPCASRSEADEQRVLAAILPEYGNRTWGIAARVNRPTDAVYRILRRLEQRGLVARHPRYSYVNDIYWVRTDEVKPAEHGTAREPNSSTPSPAAPRESGSTVDQHPDALALKAGASGEEHQS
jgi:hypothetical protein